MKVKQVQARLVERGSSFRQFALSHGYQPRTVTQVVTRWAGKPNQPNGRLSWQILRDLSRFIDEEVLPGVLSEDQEMNTAPSELIMPATATPASGLANGSAGLDLSAELTDRATPVPLAVTDEHDLLAALEARLAEEVGGLIGALGQFSFATQAIHEELPKSAQFGKLVTLLLGSFSLQMAQALSKDSHLPLLSDDGALRLHQLGLSRDEFIHEFEVDGRRFLAVALVEQGGTQVFKDRDAGARAGDQ